MGANETSSVEQRLRAIEDRLAIYQIVCGYGYAVDGLNTEAIGALYAPDGVYAVGDIEPFVGRDHIAAMTSFAPHLELVNGGCAHVSTLPYVVLEGDRAAATCYTMVVRHTEDGFSVYRCSASRLELSRKAEGGWEINHRQNYLLNGDKAGPALLARLKEGPGSLAAV